MLYRSVPWLISCMCVCILLIMHTSKNSTPLLDAQEGRPAPGLWVHVLDGLRQRLLDGLLDMLSNMAALWPRARAQQRSAFLREVRSLAAQRGYAVIEVDNKLIEMLLIQRQTRIVVMTSARDFLGRDYTRTVMELMRADAAWVMQASNAARTRRGESLVRQVWAVEHSPAAVEHEM